MEWFTVDWWRWRLAQARGRNPLVRVSDRIETVVLVLAVAASLSALPVAGAVGTAVHDERARTYAAEQQSRHKVGARTSGDSAVSSRTAVFFARARWEIGGTEHIDTIESAHPLRAGAEVDIWVDRDGNRVAAPRPHWQAGVEAVVAALGVWFSTTMAAALLVGLIGGLLKRTRSAAWNREIASLADDGRANRKP